MKKKRVTLDERGYPSIEIRNRDGVYEKKIDESAIRRLDKGALSLADTKRLPALVPGVNPYDSGKAAHAPKTLKQRSKLDYMRALSEEIKKRRREGSS